mgnify:FL=1
MISGAYLFFLYSQKTKIDSLKIELQKHKTKDTTRVNILYDLAFATFHIDEKLAKFYINEAEEISNNLNFIEGKADVLFVKGILETRKSNYEINQ